jgi:hypothetical protein
MDAERELALQAAGAQAARECADLPDWIRPGAKLAALNFRDSYWLLTVSHITKTQIVCVPDANQATDYRFEREATSHFGDAPAHRLRGKKGTRLVQRSHPDVTRLRIDALVKGAAEEAGAARTRYGQPRANGDDRPIEERALSLLDDIENAARLARRQVLHLIASCPELSGHADGQS